MYYKGMIFTQKTFVYSKTVVLTRNHCCSGKTTMRSVCFVELYVSDNNERKLSATQSIFVASL